ncbi:hypothetical protein ABZ816_01655 [Actinosynnema sp. NPDC047251]|uniref:Putative secreted protein n=1 Tax=Saccharothrix espanaensis (strain ATCC 51144 / DSM 44229 / JCM 9112 / NBRC 15066 / NRRL 15764) TaxID=1179773 RepID=K0JXU0_SACES|nr:hypothetical protein [Saccharothrix espanaensis]CCH30956.1 putative secreted protein [Saccharothrix espanaensis DSM 44229]
MRSVVDALRRMPFTAAVVAVMLVVGVATGALWTEASAQPWYGQVAFGVPALEAGRWWTPVTGAFLAFVPLAYLPMAGSFALFVGAAEWLRGTKFAVVAAVVSHLGAVLLSVLLLVVLRATGWEWAVRVAGTVDVGFSAGALAVGAVVSATLAQPWRSRIRLGLGLYVVASFVFLGSLADVEHLVAGVAGLAVGARADRVPRVEAVRLAVVSVVVVTAAGFGLGAFLPTQSPLGDNTQASTVLAGIAVSLVVGPLLAFGVPRKVLR